MSLTINTNAAAVTQATTFHAITPLFKRVFPDFRVERELYKLPTMPEDLQFL